VGPKKRRKLPRDRRILRIRQSKFLQGDPRRALRQFAGPAMRQEPVQHDLFDLGA
jgi:hypothetical protein